MTNVTGFDRTTIFRSHLTLNSLAAVFQVITQGTSTLTEIESCVVTGNQDGLISDGTGGPSYIYLSNSTVAGNEGTGILLQNGGFIYSRVNNTVENNLTNGSFTGSYAAK